MVYLDEIDEYVTKEEYLKYLDYIKLKMSLLGYGSLNTI